MAQQSNPHPVVTMTLENGGVVTIELYPEQAPNTVNNFIHLVSQKYYDGLIFHRVIPGFMVQGGCPSGTGTGGPGYSIKGEFFRDPADRKSIMRHTRGVISMARSAHPDSAGSQFFLMVADAPHLDGQYASFGKVTSGMEAVDQVVSQPRDHMDRPKKDQKIKTVTVDTQGLPVVEPQKSSR